MIRFGSSRRKSARPAHGRPRPLGAWFGILALLVQLLVSALPMPSDAATTAFDHDLTRICSTHHPGGLPDRAPQPLHGHEHCVVCAAAQLGTSTLPPPAVIFIGRTRAAVTTTAGFGIDRLIAATPSRSHQPRGPPATF
jgi:hypothetical protein